MKYVIPYDHIEDELKTDERMKQLFHEVKDLANKYKLELLDSEFYGFLKLRKWGADVNWIMRQMEGNNKSFTGALVAYITC
ncbi:hypothetical protein ACTHPT_14565 [Bacillus altitudinis]|uniref:hypothetical protein n=1 Tax=Bacillus TaxID=1386 RepID=UPI002280501F|nr:hypothetical protein [Bacillus safensis]MCY7542422.1 hypothetical protein [Bacillus safensis]MCY7552245.1 hypothetical protein [Bacillus safensis]MCY7644728.1 hypothetical protein [Bacillus safensis]MCY7655957.1 hypothetical protein [Bacillus safensis]MEC3710432.1 hypothetical protein [Bacillus safensis]